MEFEFDGVLVSVICVYLGGVVMGIVDVSCVDISIYVLMGQDEVIYCCQVNCLINVMMVDEVVWQIFVGVECNVCCVLVGVDVCWFDWIVCLFGVGYQWLVLCYVCCVCVCNFECVFVLVVCLIMLIKDFV